MIPQFLEPHKEVDVPPPPGFTAAECVTWARFDKNVVALPSRGQSFAQRTGLRFERQVQQELSSIFEEDYFNNPWFSFRDATGPRRCRPDGLLLPAGREGLLPLVIFEIKIRHMPDAWWQLRKLYHPVIKKVFPEHQIRLVEIVKEFDPAMPFPETPLMLNRLEEIWQLANLDEIGVFVWKK